MAVLFALLWSLASVEAASDLCRRSWWRDSSPGEVLSRLASASSLRLVSCQFGAEPAHYAAAYAADSSILKALSAAGVDLNALDDDDQSPLHYACLRNPNSHIHRFLLDKARAQINGAGKRKRTPLMWAAWSNPNPLVIKLLLEKGADFSARDESGQDALSFAVRWNTPAVVKAFLDHRPKRPLAGGNLLHLAMKRHRPLPVVALLLQAGVNPNEQNAQGQNALHAAARVWRNRHIVSTLLKWGGNVKARDKQGLRPCDLAMKNPVIKGTHARKALCPWQVGAD